MKKYWLSFSIISILCGGTLLSAADNSLKSISLFDSVYTPKGAEALPGFDAGQTDYILPLSFNYTGDVPQVSVETKDASATYTITQAQAVIGSAEETTARITVKASGLPDKTYTLRFERRNDYIQGFVFDSSSASGSSYTSNMFSRTAGENSGEYWGSYALRANSSGEPYLMTPNLLYGAKKLSFRIKRCRLSQQDNQTSSLFVQYRTASGNWIDIDSIHATTVDDEWKKKEYEINKKDAGIQIRLLTKRSGNENELPRDFFIDDLFVSAAMTIAGYTPRALLPAEGTGALPLPQPTEYWQSDLVKMDSDGKLTYQQDADGFVLANFSHAGYKGGNAEIPHVAVVKEISPVEGDNTAHIQAAINEISQLPLNADGIRGALLLKKGLYPVKGPIVVRHDGIVLRGEGNEGNPDHATVIFDWYRDADGYKAQRNVIILGYDAGSWTNGKEHETDILDELVPVGSYTIRIARNGNYEVGDAICLYHPCSDKWLEAVKYGEVGPPGSDYAQQYAWTNSTAPITYHRYVKQIEHSATETKITLDAPVFYPLNRSLSQSTVYKFSNIVARNIGIENLRVDINANTRPDEKHAWNCIQFRNAEDCWARDVVTAHFGKSGLYTTRTTRTTFERCYALDPVAQTTGERMYNFSFSSQSQLILLKDCYARGGRHNYISNGTSTVSGCVIYRCQSEGSRTRSEGHRMWSQGLLFDSYEDFNPTTSNTSLPVLGLFNRWQQGSGHGWASANSVLWNCNVRTDYTSEQALINSPKKAKSIIHCEKPPTSQNYAIGCFLEDINDITTWSEGKTLGYVEGTNRAGLQPSSLYEAQLQERKQHSSSIGTEARNVTKTSSFYPNPTSDFIHLSATGDTAPYLLEIFSLNGEKVFSVEVGGQHPINISSLSPGAYLTRLVFPDYVLTDKLFKL